MKKNEGQKPLQAPPPPASAANAKEYEFCEAEAFVQRGAHIYLFTVFLFHPGRLNIALRTEKQTNN